MWLLLLTFIRQAGMKFRYGLCSLKIFNAILLRFSRLLRNSPRSWVRHTRRPASPGTLEKPHPKAKSSMSLHPHLNFLKIGFILLDNNIMHYADFQAGWLVLKSSAGERAWFLNEESETRNKLILLAGKNQRAEELASLMKVKSTHYISMD
jgi:hypothetical protein